MSASFGTFREALDDPAIFGGQFEGETWRAWRVLASALFGDALTADELATFRHHTGRGQPPAAAVREAALIVGRRGGKSRVLGTLAAYLATHRDYAPHLAPGEVATIAVIAADRRQARQIFRYCLGALQAVPELAGMIEDTAAEAITLDNRVVIEIATASWRVTRGYTFAAVLADEIAFWRDDASANPDAEIIAAIRPGLATIPGAMLLLASSPYAKRGVLYTTFRKHWARDDARVLVWRGTTAEMNPGLDPGFIAAAYEDDPASAAAEYGAEFRNDIAAFVTREAVEACIAPGRFELPRVPGVRYAAFTDPSGGSQDAMTLAVAHREGDRAVLDAVRVQTPPFSPEGTVGEFATLLKSYGITAVTGDRYAGEWPREQFRKQGIAYDVSEKAKSDLYRDLLPVLNSGRCELLDLPKLTAQLCGLERRTARGGRDSIDHAPGAHDDVANAVAGALLKVGAARGPMKINPAVLARVGGPPAPHGAFPGRIY
ncbi:hypothetical protein ACE7GA_01455 [Roseomonas sp. CCTCC AB2023176]|uniref:hypothetical protein n=1 Tax=Roseomonas sp. CCTCC AB2023176 TaxID=3342640 RepID=UPI0035DD0E4B